MPRSESLKEAQKDYRKRSLTRFTLEFPKEFLAELKSALSEDGIPVATFFKDCARQYLDKRSS